MAFLPVTLIIYFIVPQRFVRIKNLILLIMSLVFYGWGEPKYVLVMVASIIVNYVLALLIQVAKKHENKVFKVFLLIADIVVNIGLLAYFKYTDFFIDTMNSLASIGWRPLGIALPIGISFYTFQTMSYVIDVYRGKVKAQKDFIALASYITMFPQLIAGPIVRYSDIETKLINRRTNLDQAAEGVRRFIIGFAKKVLLANQIAVVWDKLYGVLESGGTLSVAGAWLGAMAFTFQIYFDFSGYSDMAIGLGKILGFDFLENFNYPYISQSITEFWRRWHISLSSWFKEYVYIPLGGNRKGLPRQILNIIIVWALTGLWHGASWNFVLWGLYYGLLLILEKSFLLKALEKTPGFIRCLYTIVLVMIGWVIFNITDFAMLGKYLGCMFGASGAIYDDVYGYLVYSRFVLFLICIVCSTPILKRLASKAEEKMFKGELAKTIVETVFFIGIFVVAISFLVSGSYNPFLYFRF